MHVKRVQQSDLPAFAKVLAAAMYNDETMLYTMPYRDQYPESYYNYILLRTKVRYYRGEMLYLAVTDPSDSDWNGVEKVMGYCSLSTTVKSVSRPCPAGWLGNWFEQKAISWTLKYTELTRANRAVDTEAESHFRAVMGSANHFGWYFATLPELQQSSKQDQHWELELLGVHPDFRRRGVGTMLLQVGFEKAEVDNVPLILVATIMGKKLYLNSGFKEVAQEVLSSNDECASSRCRERLKELDLGQGKGQGCTWAAMIWEPRVIREMRNSKTVNTT